MVEYSVETLVHLYDSLNDQITDLLDTLHECNSIGYDPHLEEHYREEIERQQRKLNDRLSMLGAMREKVEIILNRILTAEVND